MIRHFGQSGLVKKPAVLSYSGCVIVVETHDSGGLIKN